MSPRSSSVADAILQAASQLPEAERGSSCSQTSFKINGKAFLFIGRQGGRNKVMLKLDKSMPEAESLAEQLPDDVQVGKQKWVTIRFMNAAPVPTRQWKKWLKESYQLSGK